MRKYKFWFYFRKAIFQGFLPALLALMTFWDFIKQTSENNNSHMYTHLYLYTSSILFLYSQLRIILEFIFSICSDDIIFKKEVNLVQTTPELLLSFHMSESSNEHFIIIIKKIFKLRYSNSSFFKYVDKICWFLGVDSPILIPYDVISKLGNVKNDLTQENEESFLHTTLSNLCTYHPTKYNSIGCDKSETDELLPKVVITKLDKSINDLQQELFNKQEIGNINV
ncbi:MAG: hypothetical protein Satyrvirus9_20 [Satyrvirus sp.]|uniref:Uncharacterized protein n=1 Tax=Satyrvirus sp. TaxID=2487771 RepID=A0A3G5AFC9_9VIRU|nr:MAG: hypothetical protein Satyrvirus9_20 [Satyrvirus sp.]